MAPALRFKAATRRPRRVPEVDAHASIAIAAALLCLAPSPALACDEEGVEADPPAAAVCPAVEPLVVRQGAWLDSEVDTGAVMVEPGTFLVPLRRPAGAWVAEYWFVRVPGAVARAVTMEEAADLVRQGQLSIDGDCGLVAYQVLLYAQDPAQAARLVRAMKPRVLPPLVVEALVAADRP